jgi:fatty acid-binding protein DegV
MRLAATVPTLEHLVRGGRVPNIAGWAGRRLGIAPLFEFRDGRAHPLRPALGTTAAYDRILARWRRGRVPDARLHVVALHADAPVDAENLLDRVRGETEPATAFVGEFGSVMVAHTGPGLVGLAWRWEPLGDS